MVFFEKTGLSAGLFDAFIHGTDLDRLSVAMAVLYQVQD